MDKGLAVFLMACVGGLIALQAPINAGLGAQVVRVDDGFGATLATPAEQAGSTDAEE